MRLILFLVIVQSIILTAQIRFSGNFESGNISSVTTADSVTYYVTTIEDINGRWFYFKMITHDVSWPIDLSAQATF